MEDLDNGVAISTEGLTEVACGKKWCDSIRFSSSSSAPCFSTFTWVDVADHSDQLPPNKPVLPPDTPQIRGGNPYFFNENPYQSVPFIYASMYREKIHAIHIAMQFAKKIATLCNKNRQPAANNQNRSFTSRGATDGLGLRL